MSQHPGGLLCPACHVDLVMSDRQGVEIDYCPRCRGVWLDRGELDKILERTSAELGMHRGAGERSHERHDAAEHRTYGHHGHHPHRRRKSFLDDFFDFD